ncbi:outer membrane protein [Shewanella xiamenensis]|uniref:outer membrane protein n=1 Tax=Shewanella xiamenensis TaxID=332186 RepID=UPI00244CB3F4|nr:outer membrane beta-barrel protein [Shewanella xiamenensis]MDH1627182.1 porin family protein [Shewanella xiamenensis]MDV5246297.1 outer membrane beta-barrel protein [Shewanella xiamenensis]
MKKVILGLLVAMSPVLSMAAPMAPANQWVAGVSYMNLADESNGLDISVDGIAGSLGYQFKSGENFYLVPELRFGTGVGSDSFSVSGINVEVELDSFTALSVRVQFEFDNGLYLYVAPSYANAEFTASASFMGQSATSTEDSWEFGVGGGVGYRFSQLTSVELSYEQFDGVDVLSVGFKFHF